MSKPAVASLFRYTVLTGAVIALLAGGTAAARQPAEAKAPPAPREVKLVHKLDAERADALQALAERFNESARDVRVALVKGDWSETDLPHMLILEGQDTARFLAAGAPRFKPLHTTMREAGVPLRTVKPPAVVSRHKVDAQGRLVALPVGMSTPVLFVNRSAMRASGLDPDRPITTWLQLQETLGDLIDKGATCPYTVAQPGRVMIENVSAWHNQPVAQKPQRGPETPRFNGMLQVKHVAMMASWHRANYLRIFDSEREAEQRFAAGECALIAAPSSSWANFRRAGRFELGIAPLPYHDDVPGAPQNTLADGAALWVAAGKRPADYKAVARFVEFFLQPENQVAWQRATGYLPLNRAGLLAAESEILGDDLENVRVAVAQLTNKVPTPNSSASLLTGDARILAILDEELKGVWSDAKPAKQALDDAVLRAQPPAAPAPAAAPPRAGTQAAKPPAPAAKAPAPAAKAPAPAAKAPTPPAKRN